MSFSFHLTRRGVDAPVRSCIKTPILALYRCVSAQLYQKLFRNYAIFLRPRFPRNDESHHIARLVKLVWHLTILSSDHLLAVSRSSSCGEKWRFPIGIAPKVTPYRRFAPKVTLSYRNCAKSDAVSAICAKSDTLDRLIAPKVTDRQCSFRSCSMDIVLPIKSWTRRKVLYKPFSR